MERESLTLSEKEEIVRKGYNLMAGDYHGQRNIFGNKKELDDFVGLLPRNANVLDVGCGAGVPVTQVLVDSGFNVTGVDFSESMLNLATKNVPEATFLKKNMTELDFKDNSFDGLTACYSIIHVPKEKHVPLFQTFHRILKPNGILLISMGSTDWEGTEDFHGVKMFWSHYDPEKTLQMLIDAGFEIFFEKHIVDGGEKHFWILAKNRKQSTISM
jgi:ubiquinone/menaquinone biosynthesis C-methylase UbiE